MTTPLLEAFELVAQSEQLLPRLDAAAIELAKRAGLEEEKTWLEAARQRMGAFRAGDLATRDLLTRALRLPDLESVKGDHVRLLQGALVDALEQVQAGIVFAAGPRAPLLEALYYKLKIPALRRSDRDELEAFCVEFEKRLASGYARRMLADPSYGPVNEALARLHKTVATWRSVFIAPPAEGDEAEGLRRELEAAARALEIPGRQARLLAQAALLPLKDSAEPAVLAIQKPKKRGRGGDEEDTHQLLEQDPPDPEAPTPEELAEIDAARSSA